MFTITRYSCLLFLGIRIGFKTLQFIAKLQTSIKKSDISELWEFFSKQNVNEILLHNLTVAFFIVQYCEKEEKLKSGWQEHLLGWAIFLAWIDLMHASFFQCIKAFLLYTYYSNLSALESNFVFIEFQ